MHGSVACGGENVSGGTVSFVPIEAGVGRISMGRIVEGQYRIDAAGGVPQGKYRVQVDARRKTGRRIQGNNGIEQAMIDEQVPHRPPGLRQRQIAIDGRGSRRFGRTIRYCDPAAMTGIA